MTENIVQLEDCYAIFIFEIFLGCLHMVIILRGSLKSQCNVSQTELTREDLIPQVLSTGFEPRTSTYQMTYPLPRLFEFFGIDLDRKNIPTFTQPYSKVPCIQSFNRSIQKPDSPMSCNKHRSLSCWKLLKGVSICDNAIFYFFAVAIIT